MDTEYYEYSSKDDKVKSYKKVVSVLGLTTPPEVMTPPILEQVGGVSPPQGDRYFLTLAFPDKQKMKLNKATTRFYRDYTTVEQYKIVSRYHHFLDDIADSYTIYFEFTKEVNLHLHCVIVSSLSPKDIKILSKRFFSIDPRNAFFIDVRLVNDICKLEDYLTNKTVKGYQTTGIKPLIKINTIETFL